MIRIDSGFPVRGMLVNEISAAPDHFGRVFFKPDLVAQASTRFDPKTSWFACCAAREGPLCQFVRNEAVNVGDCCEGVHHQIIMPVGAVEGRAKLAKAGWSLFFGVHRSCNAGASPLDQSVAQRRIFFWAEISDLVNALV